MSTKTIITIGEFLWDILPTGKVLGGSPANFSYRADALGSKSALISKLGDDELGKKAFEIIKQKGLNTDYLQWDKNFPTGTVDVRFDENRNPDYTINTNVAYDNIEYNDKIEVLIKNSSCIVYSILVQRTEKTRNTIYKMLETAGDNCIKFLDINLRKECYSKETIIKSLEYANILKLNNNEALTLKNILSLLSNDYEDIANELISKYNLDICLMTLEEKGALVISKKGEKIYDPGYIIKLEDPLGAGDAFSAAFLHTYLETGSVFESTKMGNKVGAIVATQKGAMEPINVNDIKNFYTQTFERSIEPSLAHLNLVQG